MKDIVGRYDLPGLGISFLIVDDSSPLGENIAKRESLAESKRRFLEVLESKREPQTLDQQGWRVVPLLQSVFLSASIEKSKVSNLETYVTSCSHATLEMLTLNYDKSIDDLTPNSKGASPKDLDFISSEDVVEVFI